MILAQCTLYFLVRAPRRRLSYIEADAWEFSGSTIRRFRKNRKTNISCSFFELENVLFCTLLLSHDISFYFVNFFAFLFYFCASLGKEIISLNA